jgi:8-oxo-dGTP pyrophosphatase MutT (NUDIX family)
MYKVFIDHKPVVFISKDELSTKSQHLVEEQFVSIRKTIKPLLKKCSIDDPLFFVADDPEQAFKAVFSDHIKIKAAGGLVRRKEKYLLIKRNGMWDIPKGRIDKGEKKKEACIREIAEECGIQGHLIIDSLTQTYHTMKYKGRKGLKKTYWYLLEYDGPKQTTPERKEGITKAKWMPLEHVMEIRGRTFGSINDVLDAFQKKLKQ